MAPVRFDDRRRTAAVFEIGDVADSRPSSEPKLDDIIVAAGGGAAMDTVSVRGISFMKEFHHSSVSSASKIVSSIGSSFVDDDRDDNGESSATLALAVFDTETKSSLCCEGSGASSEAVEGFQVTVEDESNGEWFASASPDADAGVDDADAAGGDALTASDDADDDEDGFQVMTDDDDEG